MADHRNNSKKQENTKNDDNNDDDQNGKEELIVEEDQIKQITEKVKEELVVDDRTWQKGKNEVW